MHRFAILFLLILQSAGLPATALAAFTDIRGSANIDAITSLEAAGVLEGYGDGTFRPGAAINRAEFLKIILAGRGTALQDSGEHCFPDVRDEWFAPYVCSAKAEGIIGGYPDGQFKPDRRITFVEAAKILSLAYKHDIPEDGGEWFEKFVLALESAKAIPESVTGFEKEITRGDMAEMMWRVKDGVTTRPSKAFINLRHPEIAVNLGGDEPVRAETCADLSALTQSERGQGFNGLMMDKAMDAESGAPATAMPALQRTGGGSDDFSTTNVQVEGVDEADIVKTDGTYLYILSQSASRVRIVRADAGDLTEVSSISFAGGRFSPSDLYVEGDRLVILGSSWSPTSVMRDTQAKMMIYPPYGGSTQQAVARIYDIADAKNPTVMRTVSFDGSMLSTRRIGDKLYMVINQGTRFWGGPVPLLRDATEDSVLPRFSDSAKGLSDVPVARCGNVTILPRVPSPQFLTVAVVDIDSDSSEIKRSVILGRADTLFASKQNILVASQDWQYRFDPQTGDSGRQITRLYRFSLTENGAEFAARGSVPGGLLNQFSMDEYGNTFRVATTTDAVWSSSDRSNNLYVLNQNLEIVGSITGIAKDETIYAVRFLGDRTYMVTFKTVDPLFVIDTKDPRNPKILGELKIPGYSSYLHPIDENHILGFGKEVDEGIDSDLVHDPNAVYYTAVQGLKLALFDVSDVRNPKEISKEVIGDRGSESPLLYDHRALFYDAQRGILAFPASVTNVEKNPSPTGPWDREIQREIFQGAYVFSLNPSTGFRLLGKATHYATEDCDRSEWSSRCWGAEIQRILRIDDTLYTVSNAKVQSHSIPAIKTLDELKLEGSSVGPILY